VDKQILSQLKPLVNNLQLMNSFNNYIDALIEQQQKALEQSDNVIMMHRSQGAIATLRRMKLLRESVNNG